MNPLPSWRPGQARTAVLDFLAAARDLPAEQRVAYFDNDGTLWCERPTYVQWDFLVDQLRLRVAEEPSLAQEPEFAAVLEARREAIESIGLARIAVALAGLCAGLTPEEFVGRVRDWTATAVHASGRAVRALVYRPMCELIDLLRTEGFTVGIVTGGGAEFLRAVSAELYGVPPDRVVGTSVGYRLTDGDRGTVVLRRTARIVGDANEGAAKVTNAQTQLGRRPIFAAGNSAGDAELLRWATAGPGPGLALLLDHDDPEREFAYDGRAETFTASEPVTVTADRLGWTRISMARDWDQVFAD
ncbi:MAG: HAD family hydrolase [Pseudonocardia sp.]